MKQILIFIWLILFPLSLRGQEEILLGRAYPESSFEQFARELEQAQGIRFHVPHSLVDSLRIPALLQGMGLSDAITFALEGSRLSFALVSGQVFIFEGEPLITQFHQFEQQAGVDSFSTPDSPGSYVLTLRRTDPETGSSVLARALIRVQ